LVEYNARRDGVKEVCPNDNLEEIIQHVKDLVKAGSDKNTEGSDGSHIRRRVKRRWYFVISMRSF